jgi:hypothetical protein
MPHDQAMIVSENLMMNRVLTDTLCLNKAKLERKSVLTTILQ